MSDKCKTCGGRGVINDVFKCGVCHGVGLEPDLKCKTCHGHKWLVGRYGLISCGTCNATGAEPQTSFRAWASKYIEATKQNAPTQSGWSCPRCSRIYGPSVQICVTCNTAVAAREAK